MREATSSTGWAVVRRSGEAEAAERGEYRHGDHLGERVPKERRAHAASPALKIWRGKRACSVGGAWRLFQPGDERRR
jgi:hypothetical protein